MQVNQPVRREAILDRIARVRPRVLAIVAPAGYGKSELVRQLREDAGGVLIHGEGAGAEIVQALAAALEAAEPGPVVLERADEALSHAEVQAALSRLVPAMDAGRSFVLVGRGAPALRLSRIVAPHEVLTIGAADLAFDRDAVRLLLSGDGVDENALTQILEATRGWPAAVLMVARWRREGRLSREMPRLAQALAVELRDYLLEDVLGELEPAATDVLFACAALPRPEISDLRAVVAHHPEPVDVVERCASSPLIEAVGSELRLHPIVAALLLAGDPARAARVVREVAGAQERGGDPVRAAELLHAMGESAEAVRVLARHDVLRDRRFSARSRELLGSLDRAVLGRVPGLWAVAAVSRLFCDPFDALLDEAETLWRTMPLQTAPIDRALVLAVRVMCMTQVGLIAEAERAVDAFFTDELCVANRDVEGFAHYLRGVVDARAGRIERAERELNQALSQGDDVDIRACIMYLSFAADVARVRGEAPVERQLLERAMQRGRSAMQPNLLAIATAEALICAWIGGNSRAMRARADELDGLVNEHGVRGLRFLASVALGRTAEPQAADVPRYVAYARLIEAARLRSRDERLHAASAALAAARATRLPAVEAHAAVALAALDESHAEQWLQVARTAAARVESVAFAAAIEALAEGDDDVGMLEPFVARFRGSATHAPATIDVLAGEVAVDGASVRLSSREMELLAALAVRREPVPRARLAAMLWPDLDERAARNALSVCLHRLRVHLDRDDVVLRDGGGYRLHEDLRVDLWEAERTAALARSRDLLTGTDRAAFRRTWQALARTRDPRLERWEWFAPALRRLGDLRTDIAHRLGIDALDRGETSLALTYATAVIDEDACDEAAREVAIMAHLRDGDRAAAVRHYRQYRDAVIEELGIEPSAKLAALVAE